MTVSQLPLELSHSIERCASALGNAARLKEELSALKANGDSLAHFAAALFELELARGGDAESRAGLTHLAEVLLVFWRDGSGDELSHLHPSLDSLWRSVAPMLVQFELRHFEKALAACWKARAEPEALVLAIEALAPEGNRRVEFARCLYHLELARKGIALSRVEFAKRAGLLAEAYQDPAFARDLIGADAGLRQLWSELEPYLDEFFESLEEQAARAQEGTKKVKVPVAPPGRRELRTEPALPAAPAPLPATPPGGVQEAEPLLEAELAEPPAPPPPPPDLTPPGAWKPPQTTSGEVELVDIEEELAPPPPPPITPAHGLAAAIAFADDIDVEVDFEPDEATLAFWDYTFAALQQAPVEGQKPRMLAAESRSDRKRLTTWLDGMNPHLPVPEGRAFAALVRLLLAGETKEKSLFGQANPRRKEALTQAFALLAPTPEAAGHAAVWFELDGPETREALGRGLELLTEFLAFCARHTLDPLAAETVAKYLEP